ncbi:hypothetical protein GCK32_004607 [Trichostrongylus colubriformis]|uniref:SCP domain-containing protein n=1 Tax=Trichostrongylus colubriformis TaxID=6319 RepID=A0AAN8IQR0_TRICO
MAYIVILQKIFIMLCALDNVSSQQCPGNSNMTDDLRDTFLNTHNTLRSSRSDRADVSASSLNARIFLNRKAACLQMAWHDSVRLGCGIQRCRNFYFVVCQYGPGGNIIGEDIYDVGPTCSRCPIGTTCERANGLCGTSTTTTSITSTVISTTTTSTTPVAITSIPTVSPNVCPGNSGMTETLRNTFLNKHNVLRSSLAKGTGAERNGPTGPAPPASNMEEMMAWHDNVRLGCAIQRCRNFYFVVCQYGPGGNIVGGYIYNVAAVCSECPFGTACNSTTALCVRRSQ